MPLLQKMNLRFSSTVKTATLGMKLADAGKICLESKKASQRTRGSYSERFIYEILYQLLF
ncbi:hypothetical protein [Nitrosococcus watsonii]|uniref:Uncharacterized protein n=1 Tax=Nitrosococcus watsoni (strain C-113) TaxID=105559 RepID=D8K6Z2_NITWC|nr:hypothetical protein [Nitrosococcus watsonii]ADJ28669.1 hypothetical protein Nwat_1813 [Nitrosococcus watsonii C-113]